MLLGELLSTMTHPSFCHPCTIFLKTGDIDEVGEICECICKFQEGSLGATPYLNKEVIGWYPCPNSEAGEIVVSIDLHSTKNNLSKIHTDALVEQIIEKLNERKQ